MLVRFAALPLLMVALAACQAQSSRDGGAGTAKSAALRSMETVAIAAHKCWFASGDPAFRHYKFANELNSFSGQPRFLLVPVGNFGGRPLLVVQAKGNSPKVNAFGPLLSEPIGKRITSDLGRWTAGDTSCGSAA